MMIHQATPSQLRFIAEKKARDARIAAKAFRPVQIAERMAEQTVVTERVVEDFQAQFDELWQMLEVESRHSLREVVRAVCEYYDVTAEQITSDRRTKDMVRPRHVAFYLGRRLVFKSTLEIGRRMGGRDHTTVMNGESRIAAKLLVDAELRSEVSALIQIIEGL